MAAPTPTLLIFPGLAADARLFAPQARAFAGWRVPAFVPPRRGEALEDYAARLAPTLAALLPADGREPYWLGGFSFGSQLAQELVRHMTRPPAGLVLLCAVRGRHQVLPSFVLQQRVGALIPGALARRAYGPFARRFARRCGLSAADGELLVAMARDNDPAFLNWSARACARWRGEPDLRGVPVLHVHGERDDVIPDVRREADVTIPGAGHLITLTHAREVNEAIGAFVQRTATPGGSAVGAAR